VAVERVRPVVVPQPAVAPAGVAASPAPAPPPLSRPLARAPGAPRSAPVAEDADGVELGGVAYRSLEDRQQDVLDLLVEGGQQTRRQLQASLGWSRSTLRNVLEALIAEGRVMPSAEPVRSPFRTYALSGRKATVRALRRG